MAKELEAYMKEVGVDGDRPSDVARADEDSEEDAEDDEEQQDNSDVEEKDEHVPEETKLSKPVDATQLDSTVTDRFGNNVSVAELKLQDET